MGQENGVEHASLQITVFINFYFFADPPGLRQPRLHQRLAKQVW